MLTHCQSPIESIDRGTCLIYEMSAELNIFEMRRANDALILNHIVMGDWKSYLIV